MDNSILSHIGNTPIYKIQSFDVGPCELFVKLENQNPGGSIKDRIGLTIIEEAEKSGELLPGGTIIEATAGNTGIGLALVAAIKGYKLIIVMPDKMSRDKILHVKGLGAEVVLTRSDVGKGHPEYFQDLAKRMSEEIEGSFLASQFTNPANALAHKNFTAPEIWEQMDKNIDAVVLGIGSGGTITGMGQFFKEKDPKIQMIAADPEGSVIADAVIKGSYSFDGATWLVEGIGEDFIPDVLDLSLIDDAVTVSDKEAFEVARKLLKEEGILAGSSSGTLLAGAINWCKKQKEPKKVVTIICDTGNKYLSKVFNDAWLMDNGLLDKEDMGDLSDLINRRADKGEMIHVSPTDTLLTAYNRMRASDVSQLPVLKNEKELIGVIDEEDLLLKVFEDRKNFKIEIKEVMIKELEITQVDSPELSLFQTLQEGKVAIIFNKDVFLGFITKVDLINKYKTEFKSLEV